MPLGRGIVEVFEAIPDRIEVTGHGPTWRVTGGSFDSVVEYVREAYDDPVVIAREDRGRWWPRVTLTVTTDPDLAADAPSLETFRERPEADKVPAQGARRRADTGVEQPPRPVEEPHRGRAQEVPSSPLEEIFAHQEELRQARHVPEQRPSAG